VATTIHLAGGETVHVDGDLEEVNNLLKTTARTVSGLVPIERLRSGSDTDKVYVNPEHVVMVAPRPSSEVTFS